MRDDVGEEGRGSHLVVCTPEGERAGERFRDLTGRELLSVDGPHEVDRLLRSGAVATALLSLGQADLRTVARLALTAHHERVGLGWLFGWMGEAVAVAHAEKTAGYRFGPDRSGLVWSSLPLGTVRDAATGELRVVCGRHPDGFGIATRPRSFSAIASHGLGIDMWLGDGLLCSALDAAPRTGGGALHPCQCGGPCLRGTGTEPPHRLEVSRLASDLLVLDSCRSLRLSGKECAPCLASAAVASRHAGALLVAVGESWGVPAAHVLAWHRWRLGATAGEVLRLENATNLAAMGTAPFLLLGDPTATLGPAPARPAGTGEDDCVSADGGTRVRVVACPDDRLPVLAWNDRPAGRPRVWAQAVHGSGLAVVVSQSSAPEDGTALEDRDDPVARLREELLGAAPAVATARALAVTVGPALDEPGSGAADRLAADLDGRLRAIARLRAGFPAEVAHGGDRDARDSWLRRESAAWQRTQEQLADTMSAFALRTGGLDDAFGDAEWEQRAPGSDPGESCPYCDGPVERRHYRLPAVSRGRDRLVCWGCDVLSEVPAGSEAIVLAGPFEVTAGGTAAYRLSAGDVRFGAVRFGVVTVPWGYDVRARPGAGWPPAAGSRHRPDWTLEFPAGPPGLYAVIASAVAAGEAFMAKRLVHVRPSEEGENA